MAKTLSAEPTPTNVVVIEDVKSHREFVADALRDRHKSWNVITHESASGALSEPMLSEYGRKIVICDQVLVDDVMEGIDVLLVIKRKHPDVYTILITGRQPELGVAALKLGICDFVRKDGDWRRPLLAAVERGAKANFARGPRARCFAIMPYGGFFDEYYKTIWMTAAKRAGYTITRNDEEPGGKPILREIWEALGAADVAIAELTGVNANVMYELGLAHGRRIRTIIVAQSAAKLPSDVKHLHCIIYNVRRPSWERNLADDLVRGLIQAPGYDEASPW